MLQSRVPDLDAAVRQYRDVLGVDVGTPQDEPEHGVTVVFITLPKYQDRTSPPIGG